MSSIVLAIALLGGVRAAAIQMPSPNLISNGGFEAPVEENSAPPGFRITPFDSRVTARGEFAVTEDAHSGTQALRVTRTNADSGYAVVLPAPEFAPPEQPRRLLLTAWVKVLGTRGRERDAPIRVQAFTPEWTGACRAIHETLPHRYLDGWSRYTILLEQHPGSALVHLRFPIEAANPGDGVVLDDIALYEVDGWSDADVKASLAPLREAGAQAVDALSFREGNLLVNSSFELGLRGGWSIPELLPEQQRACVVEGEARHGGRVLRFEMPSSEHMTLTGRFITVRPNQTYSLSVWAKTDRDGVNLTARFENGYVPEGGGPHAISQQERMTPNQWQRVVATGVTEAGPENAYAVRVTATGPEGAVVLLDAAQFEEGPARDYSPSRAVEAAIRLSEVTGISGWDEPLAYEVCVFNSGADATDLPLQVNFSDFFGRDVVRHDVGDTFPPGSSVVAMSHLAPARGALRARLMHGEELADEATFTVVPPVRHPERHPGSRFGQHVRLEQWQMGVAKRLGACWTRLHDASKACSWDYVEPEPGTWVWADDEIDAARAVGLEVLGVFGRCPGWAAEPDATGNAPTAGGWYYPADLNAWARYVEETARHYRGKIDVWEIWNEPYGFGVGDGAKYAALARAAYNAAKRGNPDCTVLGFCTWEGATDFNRAALAGGTMDACDIVSFHLYTRDGYDAWRRTNAVKEVLGLGEMSSKPLWHTEGLGGYTRTWHSYIVDAVDDPYSRRPGAPMFAPEDAAVTGVRAIVNSLAAGAEKVFWYWSPWEDGGSIRPDRYTWFEFDGQLKPHAAAYAACAWFLDGAEPLERVETGEIVVCLFARGNAAVAVAWAASETEVMMPLPKEATTYDVMGNRLEPKAGSRALSAAPVYIVLGAEPALVWAESLRK